MGAMGYSRMFQACHSGGRVEGLVAVNRKVVDEASC